VKNRIAISVSPTTVLRRRGWSSMCAEDWTPPTGSLPISSPSPLLYLLLPFSPFLSFYFANAQCMYVRMHACMQEVLFFRFREWFVWNPKKTKIRFLLLSVVLAASLRSLYNLQIWAIWKEKLMSSFLSCGPVVYFRKP
jgi:hypothetical protein